MENIKRNIFKIVGIFLIIGVFFIFNAFLGNPVSKNLAKRESEKYIKENYSHLNLEREKLFFNIFSQNAWSDELWQKLIFLSSLWIIYIERNAVASIFLQSSFDVWAIISPVGTEEMNIMFFDKFIKSICIKRNLFVCKASDAPFRSEVYENRFTLFKQFFNFVFIISLPNNICVTCNFFINFHFHCFDIDLAIQNPSEPNASE